MEHYLPIEYTQSQEQESALPQLSETLLSLIKKMMSSDPSGRPSIHEICDHPVIQRIRKHQLPSSDLPEWSDTECDEPGPSQSQSQLLSRTGSHLAGPALVPESTTTLAALLRIF
jgi:serine/threonine protein kinase